MTAGDERRSREGRIIDLLSRNGIAMHSSGVHNWALTRELAVSVLDELDRLRVPVLGGDVYEEHVGGLRPVYDNWYCDRAPGEANESYCLRANAKARSYIINYATQGRYFVLVL